MSRFALTSRTIPGILLLALWLTPTIGFGQDPRTEFTATMDEWKAVYVELLEAYARFSACEEWEADEARAEFLEVKKRGDQLQLKALDKAAALYTASEQNVEALHQMLSGMPLELFNRNQYEIAARVGLALCRHDPNNRGNMFETIKYAFFSNQFELANAMMMQWNQQFNEVPPQLEPIEAFIPDYLAAWKLEEQLRAAEQSANPAPQIEFETERGTFVVELYEDDFPTIVNNLISLIEERQLYKGFAFFEVLQHHIVRGGCARNDGSTMLPVAPVTAEMLQISRKHFRGSFSLLANSNQTVATQFIISRIPLPNFDGQHLVIGRVVDGMDVVDRLTNTHQLDAEMMPAPLQQVMADPIQDIRVLRKRDHEYKFIDNSQ